MKAKATIAVILTCISMTATAQDANNEEEPKGKAIIQVFGNFHTGFGKDKDDRGFDLERSYIGCEYKAGHGLSIKGVLDIGKSKNVSDYERIAYLKNAMIQWQTGNLTLSGGLISTTQFAAQEKFWGYRYIMKSFQDEYKFGSSADLGISAAYRFASWITADAIIVNGEGYKKIQKTDGLNYGLGLTVTPVKGFQIRMYGSYNESGQDGQKGIVNVSAFAGYRCDRFRIGAEYNHMLNPEYNAGAALYGYSVFTSVKAAKTVDIYARWDDLYTKNNPNKANDGMTAILGTQIQLGKYVKLAPNFRLSIPGHDVTNLRYHAYINAHFGL